MVTIIYRSCKYTSCLLNNFGVYCRLVGYISSYWLANVYDGFIIKPVFYHYTKSSQLPPTLSMRAHNKKPCKWKNSTSYRERLT